MGVLAAQYPATGADFDLPGYDDGDPRKSGEDPADPHEQGGGRPPRRPRKRRPAERGRWIVAPTPWVGRIPGTSTGIVLTQGAGAQQEFRRTYRRTSPGRTKLSLPGRHQGLSQLPLRLRVWWLISQPPAWSVSVSSTSGSQNSSLTLPSSVG